MQRIRDAPGDCVAQFDVPPADSEIATLAGDGADAAVRRHLAFWLLLCKAAASPIRR